MSLYNAAMRSIGVTEGLEMARFEMKEKIRLYYIIWRGI